MALLNALTGWLQNMLFTNKNNTLLLVGQGKMTYSYARYIKPNILLNKTLNSLVQTQMNFND